jgi:hypothetical protein
MSNTIRTYEDLLKEQQRLLGVIKTQEEIIRKDIAGVKEGLRPFGKVASQIKKMGTRDNSVPLMNFGLEFGADLFFRKFLLAKSGWLTKIIVPFLVKNYSSHIFSEEKRLVIMQKIRSFLQKIRPHASPQSYEFAQESPQTGEQPQQKDFRSAAEELFKTEERSKDKPGEQKTF